MWPFSSSPDTPQLLRPYELMLLDAISSKLSAGALRLFARQRHEINRIQRLVADKEVTLYSIHRGKILWKEELLFPNRANALALARCRFETTGIGAQLLLFSGHLGMIEFDAATRELYHDHVSEVKLLANPLVDTTSDGGITVYLDRVVLPTDYETLLKLAQNKTESGFVINAPEAMRRVLCPTYNLCVIAERPNSGAIALRENDPSGTLYWCDFENGTVTPVRKLLADAINEIASYS
jgi:hypothetical protein